MKRTPLTRKTPMPRPTKRIRVRGKPRHATSGVPDRDYRAWIRQQKCCVSGKRPVEACHVKSRGAGGSDKANLVPMTRELHASQHFMGIDSFQAFHGLDLVALAERLWATYTEEGE